MAYTKTSWIDRSVQYPSKFTSVTNADGTITLTPSPGTITNAGTPLTASAFNNLESQYDQAMADVQVQPNWINATLQNGWVTEPGTNTPARYYKDTTGHVHLSGFIANGTTTTSTILFILPAGYCPSSPRLFTGFTYDGNQNWNVQMIGVYPDGHVILYGKSSLRYVSIEIPSFKAEQ